MSVKLRGSAVTEKGVVCGEARKVITQNKANRLKSRATKAVNKKNIAAK